MLIDSPCATQPAMTKRCRILVCWSISSTCTRDSVVSAAACMNLAAAAWAEQAARACALLREYAHVGPVQAALDRKEMQATTFLRKHAESWPHWRLAQMCNIRASSQISIESHDRMDQ